MQKVATSLQGVWELRPTVFRDARGYFLETFHCAKLAGLGITETFVQDNQSCSSQGTLRGLHYQLRHPQAKLCRVVEGEVLDVAVDIRIGSPQFGAWTAVRLSSTTLNQIYIPAGFAHGFLTLTRTAIFLYKCSDFYDPSDEHGIAWNDPHLGIAWGIDTPLVSERDAACLTLRETPRELLPLFRENET